MIYAISDLHLSFSTDKPMKVFGKHWYKHYEKIEKDWRMRVTDDDLVLIPGDISWAMRLDDAKKDMAFIASMPGRKIMVKGNHDYWWQSLNKVTTAYPEFMYIQNNCIMHDNIAICGTRGWTCPNKNKFTPDDEKIYKREINRLEISLNTVPDSASEIYVMTHYPPTNDRLEPSEFTRLYEKYGVKKVIYGHLHGKESFKTGLKGIKNGIEYLLVSCDYLDFKLKLVE